MRSLIRLLTTILARWNRQRQARQHFAQWSKHVRRVGELSPEDRAAWYEEERSKWHDYYDQLL